LTGPLPIQFSSKTPVTSLKSCVMSKVYLLLRNNQQSGPFTIDELLQQQLRPTDMLWIEGSSTAWCYLTEMELKPSCDIAPRPEVKPEVTPELTDRESPVAVPVETERNKKRRSYRPDEIERKAEELRKRALTFAHSSAFPAKPELNIEDKHRARLPLSEKEAINFVDHRNEKKHGGVEVLTGILVTAFVAACIIGGRHLFLQNSNTQPRVAAQVLSTDEHTAKTQAAPVMPILTVDSAQFKPQVDSTVAMVRPKAKIPRTNKDTVAESSNENNNAEPVVPIQKKEDIAAPVPAVIKAPVEQPKNDANTKVEEAKKDITQESTAIPSAEPEEKKKGFLRGLFKKKKKNDQ
jgi:hypothetical protein